MKRTSLLSGPKSERFWQGVNTADSIPALRAALYSLACKVQALEDEVFSSQCLSADLASRLEKDTTARRALLSGQTARKKKSS